MKTSMKNLWEKLPLIQKYQKLSRHLRKTLKMRVSQAIKKQKVEAIYAILLNLNFLMGLRLLSTQYTHITLSI
jgi:hypothetical protein